MGYDFSEQLLTDVVASHIRANPDGLRIERCLTGKFNTTYFIEGAKRPMILRVAPFDDPSSMLFYEYHMMHQEPGLHALIRARTNVPCPAIIAFDTSHRHLDRDFLILERMPGQPVAGNVARSSEQFPHILRQLGRFLRQVHAITGTSYGYVGDHDPMEPQPNWYSAFKVMWNKLLDDIERCGGYRPQEAKLMRWLLGYYRDAFKRSVPATLLHMDLWAQNILVDEAGEITGLIDWDRALWGDPEIEFAVLDYCGLSEPAFWEGYGLKRKVTPESTIRQKFYLLYELQKYIFIHRVRGNDPNSADLHRRHSLKIGHELLKALKDKEKETEEKS